MQSRKKCRKSTQQRNLTTTNHMEHFSEVIGSILWINIVLSFNQICQKSVGMPLFGGFTVPWFFHVTHFIVCMHLCSLWMNILKPVQNVCGKNFYHSTTMRWGRAKKWEITLDKTKRAKKQSENKAPRLSVELEVNWENGRQKNIIIIAYAPVKTQCKNEQVQMGGLWWCFSSALPMSRVDENVVVVFWVFNCFSLFRQQNWSMHFNCSNCNVAHTSCIQLWIIVMTSRIAFSLTDTQAHTFITRPIFMFNRCATKWTNVKKRVQKNTVTTVRWKELHSSKTSTRICSFGATCPCPCYEKRQIHDSNTRWFLLLLSHLHWNSCHSVE